MSATSVLSHPLAISCRNTLRRSALLKRLYVRWKSGRDYEERFGEALLGAIRPGDVVWDVGANIGLYAAQFLERQARQVICFEPAPDALAQLRARFANELETAGRVRIAPVALGAVRDTVRFAADGASPTNRIAGKHETGQFVEVSILTGDQAMRELALPAPQVIKIDVEGYEPDVLDGLSGLLGSPDVRAVFIEVHFSLLNQRGLDAAPARMVSLLNEKGFRVEWLDLSHLGAFKT